MLDNAYKDIKLVEAKRRVYFQEERPELIWKEVLELDQDEIRKLCEAMSNLVYDVGVPKFLVHLAAKILYLGVYKRWGHYTKESDYFARHYSHLSESMMAFLQRQYTLAHMGCSVVMTWDETQKQMVCFRSLDWRGADDIASATRQFSLVNKHNEEVAQIAGITAMVGVLTGVKKGFSVCINYAPCRRSAKFKSDPTFLIRQLLEDESILTYAQAIAKVQTWEVAAPCFISICGVKQKEACVLELSSQAKPHIRYIGDKGYLIQTNHYALNESPFCQHNEKSLEGEMSEQQWYNSELLQNSQYRETLLEEAFKKREGNSLKEDLIKMYKQVPVLNWESAQWVYMQPISGEISIYALHEKP